MSWDYDPTKLQEVPKDQVRFIIGDTNEAEPLLQDEEIEFLLSENNNHILLSAIAGCDSIISKLARVPDFKIGPYSESNQVRLNAYQMLVARLRRQLSGEQAPMMLKPTTEPIFHYDMMVCGRCDHE